MKFEAIVIGGGVVGASLAYHLAHEGVKTLLVDRHDHGRATDAGAGILSPETSSTTSDAWYRFGVTAVAYYDQLIPQLKAEQPLDPSYAICGLIRVAISDDELEPYEAHRQMVFARQAAAAWPSTAALHELTPAQAADLFPALAPVKQAFYHRTAARVDGRMLCEALTQAAVAHGLLLRHASAEKLLLYNGQVNGVEIEGEAILADKVAIAGGAWSPMFGEQLGVQIPIAPQRGQIIHLHLEGQETAAWPVIHPFHGHYMVCWPGGRVVVGATRESDSGFAPYPTAAGVREVLDEALRVAPGLHNGRLADIRVGLRPYSADQLPVMGTVPNVANIYLATGHGPTGLQLGPYSGKVIADMMMQRPLSHEAELAAFAIERFLK